MTAKTLDLCVINYNTAPQLNRFLSTINQNLTMQPGFKVYIQDNSSTDSSIEYLKAGDWPLHPSMVEVTFSENVGYGRACNLQAAKGTGDIIGLLNADVWMTADQVLAVINAFNAHPEMAIMGPKQRDEQGRITHAGIFGTHQNPQHRGFRHPDSLDDKYRDFCEAVTVSGSAYFIRRSVWEQLSTDESYLHLLDDMVTKNMISREALENVGAFLPTPHYYEETWCSYFASHRGHKVYYDGHISIGHSWHASSPLHNPNDHALMSRSRVLFRYACDWFGIPRD